MLVLLGGRTALGAGTDPLRLDMGAAYAEDPQPDGAAAPAIAASGNPGNYGEPGGWFITVGSGIAHDFKSSADADVFVGFSTFLARELELQLEGGGWYFSQPGRDTGGLSASVVFRWHFWHADDFDWSVYVDGGIGVLFSFDDTPPGGTSANFLPRAGVGFTKVIDGTPARLQAGLRWHHVSNGRITGDSNNPARNSLMLYAGVVFPF